MQDSRLQAIQLPSALTRANPVSIASAGARPTRVVVRNYTLIPALVTFNPVIDDYITPSNAYLLPAGAVDIFLIAPGQTLYALGGASACKLSIAISEAFPLSNPPDRR